MTKQEMFDRAYKGVVAQGRICQGAGGACVYYDARDGSRCAWGHVLTEEQAKASPTGTCIGSAGAYNKALGYTDTELSFGRGLQRAHDYSHNVDQFMEQMQHLATLHELTIPQVEKQHDKAGDV
jgi:hypothetical protein